MEYLNMSLDEVIKVSKKDSNNKNEFKKYSTNRVNKKPIRKLNNLQASSFKNNNTRFTHKLRTNIVEKRKENSKGNFRRLRIENLDKNIDNSELRELFEQNGHLVKLGIEWDDLGRSKGSAIVEYDNEESAKNAIESYDGAELDGLVLKVDYEHNF